MKEQDYIRLDQIVKVYPPNKIALNKVTLDIHKGEIHSIIGENGAGKSTLMKVLYGLEKADEGTIWLRGQKVDITTPQEAVRQGIGMVHQEFMLISQYTVLENIVLGNEPTRHGRLDLQACREKPLSSSATSSTRCWISPIASPSCEAANTSGRRRTRD